MSPEDRAVLVAALAVLELQAREWQARGEDAASPAIRLACQAAADSTATTRAELAGLVDNHDALLTSLAQLAARAA